PATIARRQVGRPLWRDVCDLTTTDRMKRVSAGPHLPTQLNEDRRFGFVEGAEPARLSLPRHLLYFYVFLEEGMLLYVEFVILFLLTLYGLVLYLGNAV